MKYTLRIVAILILLLFAAITHAQPTLEGLRLGMKHSEVFSLVKSTGWFFLAEDEGDVPKNEYTVWGTRSVRICDYSRSSQPVYCFQMDYASLEMTRGVCSYLSIAGLNFTHKGVDSLRSAIGAALKDLTRQCGKPTEIAINPDSLTLDKLFEFTESEFPTVAEWKTKKYLLRIYLSINGPGNACPWISIKAL